MNAQEPQETAADSSGTPPKKRSSTLLHLLLLLIILAGIAAGFFIYAYRQHHRTQQTDHSLQRALVTVEENLRKNESELNDVRAEQTALAEALQKIQNTPPPPAAAPTTEPNPDISAAFEALSALDGQLDALPLEAPTRSDAIPSEPETDTTWWSRIIHILRPVWQQLVIVRHAGEEPSFITPAIRQLVILRLHSSVDAAKWAVLHHDALVYKTALDTVRHTLGQYFSADAAKPVLDRLAALETERLPENAAVTPTVH